MSDLPETKYNHPQYVARRNFWNFFGIKCRVLGPAGNLLFYSKLKAFKLKEDITVFGDDAGTQPLLSIKARQIIDFSAAYDVVDLQSGAKLGAYRRKGWKSLMKDEWEILDNNDQVVGHVKEDSAGMAFLRRFLSNLIPQHYHFEVNGNVIATLRGTWNPFVVKYDVDMTGDVRGELDRRVALAGVVLLMCIEGKQ